MGNTDALDSPWPGLGGSHHLPPYSILCGQPWSPQPNGFFLPALPSESPEMSQPQLWVRDQGKGGCKVAGQKEGSPGVKAKALQGCGPRRSPGVTSQTPRSVKKCEGVNLHTPKATPTWEMKSRWTPETSESDCRGQNSMARGVLYISENLLKRRCFK